jgi:hypothetical protein
MMPERIRVVHQDESMMSKVRFGAFTIVAALISLNAVVSVWQMSTWVRPLDRFAGKPWPEYGREPYTALAAPYLTIAEEIRGLDAVGFINGYPHWEQRMMAQSMFAPTLVTTDTRPPLIIAAFPDDGQLDAFLDRPPPTGSGPLRLRRRFGPGLALLERMGDTK